MASALDRIEQACSMAPIRHEVELPNGDVMEFFATPLTLDERAKAKAACKTDDAMEFAVRLFIMKARDAAGSPMFTTAAYHKLVRLPKNVIDKFLDQMLEEGEGVEGLDSKSLEATAGQEQAAGDGVKRRGSKGLDAG